MRANLLFHSAIALLALLSAGCVTVTVKEDHFFYPGPAENPSPLSADGDHIEALSLTTNDGVQLAGAYVRRPGAKYDVLYFGGNAARVDDYGRAVAREMSSIAANVVFIDYRGYGRSTGVPTIDELKNDALAILDHWAARATGQGDR